MTYLIEKDGKYLSSVFDPIKWDAEPSKAYRYNVPLIASDIARQRGASAVELTDGMLAYAADLHKTPRYHDGAARKTWSQLGAVEQWSWERGPLRFDPEGGDPPEHPRL